MVGSEDFDRKHSSLKVIELGLESLVLDMYFKRDMGYAAIETALKDKAFDISHMAIKNFLDWFKAKWPEMMTALKQEQLTEYAEMTMSTLKLIVTQIAEIERDIEAYKERKNEMGEGNWRELSEHRRALIKLTELFAKFRGELKTGTTITNIDNRQINVKQMNMQIRNTIIKQLEEKGDVRLVDGKEMIVIEDWPEAANAIKRKKAKVIEVETNNVD